MRHLLLTLIAATMFSATPASAQLAPLLEEENTRRARVNTVAMGVLGGWSVANIGVGVTGWATADEPWVRNFHLMNAGWNVVNLAIAGFGLYGALSETPTEYDVWETMRRSENIERALLVNAALDVAYVAGGAYLALRGDRDDDEKLLGWGRSIMLQGAFLFAFDVVVFTVHTIGNGRFMRELEKLPVRFGP